MQWISVQNAEFPAEVLAWDQKLDLFSIFDEGPRYLIRTKHGNSVRYYFALPIIWKNDERPSWWSPEHGSSVGINITHWCRFEEPSEL